MSDGQTVIDLADRLKALDQERAQVRTALDRAALGEPATVET